MLSMRSAALESASQRDPLIGLRIGNRYTIGAVHRQRSDGPVYAACDEERQRGVAIAVLDEAWARDTAAVERFMLQSRSAGALTYNLVVEAWDLGRLPDGRPFLAMPLLNKATDLRTLLRKHGPLEPTRVASLFHDVGTALDRIHPRGLVHHDLKPENLLHLTRKGGDEIVLVLGFGLALAHFANEEYPFDIYDWPTPEFMPPEAASGVIPDWRGDVYALATSAFELITGRLPFDANDVEDMARLKTTSAPPRLCEVGGHEFSPALELVLARGLATDPADRYQSAGEFTRELAAACPLVAEDFLPIEPIVPQVIVDQLRPSAAATLRDRLSRLRERQS
jgi:serine/threonine protein kinase